MDPINFQLANKTHSMTSPPVLWKTFPEELWIYIFSFLPGEALGRVSSVSWDFHRLANDPVLSLYIYRLCRATAYVFNVGHKASINHVAYAPKTGTMACVADVLYRPLQPLWIGNIASLKGSHHVVPDSIGEIFDLSGNDFGCYLKRSNREQAFWLETSDLSISELIIPESKKSAWSNILNDKIAVSTPSREIMIFEKKSLIYLIPAIENAKPFHLHLQQLGKDEYLTVLYQVREKNSSSQRKICRYSCKDGSLMGDYITPLQKMNENFEFLAEGNLCALFFPNAYNINRVLEIFDLSTQQTLSISVSDYQRIHLHRGKLVAISPTYSITVYDASTGNILRTIDTGLRSTSSLEGCSAVSNNKIAIAPYGANYVNLFDLNTGKKLHTFQLSEASLDRITSIAFDNSDPKHSFLVFGLSNGTVAVFPASLPSVEKIDLPDVKALSVDQEKELPEFIEDTTLPPESHWTCLGCLLDCCKAIGNFFTMIWSSL
jgi:hypothetical protein